MLLIGPITLLAYLVFVFASDQRRPFRRPSTPRLRRKWLYGRALGCTVLASGGTGVALSRSGLHLESTTVVLVGATVAAAGALFAVHRHVRSSEWAYVRKHWTPPRTAPAPRALPRSERLPDRLENGIDIELG